MNLDEVLSGRAELEGIQWLLRSAGPRRVLRDQLKSLLSNRSMLGPCASQSGTAEGPCGQLRGRKNKVGECLIPDAAPRSIACLPVLKGR